MILISPLLSRCRASALLSVLSLGGLAASSAQAQTYTITDLGSVAGSYGGVGLGVNNSGQVAGDAYFNSGYSHAAVSGPNGGPLHDLGTLGGVNSYGHGINDAGQVAGPSETGKTDKNGNLIIHAFLSGTNGGTLKDLGTLGGSSSQGLGVNASGQVTGYSDTNEIDSNGNVLFHAFLSDANGGALHDLGTLGGGFSMGFGVNASGQVTGDAYLANGPSHAFLSGANGGTLKDLGTLGGFASDGAAVNTFGQVAGNSEIGGSDIYGNDISHAFLSGPGGGPLIDLGTLAGDFTSYSLGVNDTGQVVGVSSVTSGNLNGSQAFLYSNGKMSNLNDLIAPGSSFNLTEATSISNAGFITGIGTASSGQQHLFLLTPAAVPESSTLASFGLLLVLGGVITALKRKKHLG